MVDGTNSAAGDMILLDKSVETVKDEAVYAFW
jgi:phage repressor protein C with HTH and peptisase S24 domain